MITLEGAPTALRTNKKAENHPRQWEDGESNETPISQRIIGERSRSLRSVHERMDITQILTDKLQIFPVKTKDCSILQENPAESSNIIKLTETRQPTNYYIHLFINQ